LLAVRSPSINRQSKDWQLAIKLQDSGHEDHQKHRHAFARGLLDR
jgi:hypothetical protein